MMSISRRPRQHRARVFSSLVVLATLVLAMTHGSAWSQSGRTIKIIVPFPAGGSADILARLLGEHIGKTQGPTMLIENRPGGGASIGYEATARAAPDGNTVVIAANSIVINPLLRKTTYDPATSFEAICYMLSSPLVYVVNIASPYRTLGDFIAAARAKPGELTLASIAPATTQHIAFEQFKRATKADIRHIPYAGGAPAVNALLGQHVTAVLANYSEVVEQLKAGTLRALATASPNRIAPLPDLPTVAESGYAGYEAEVWFGLFAPAKTPKESTAQLAAWFTAAAKAADVEPKLLALGLYPVGRCGADFAAHIAKQTDEYGRIIREANIKPD